MTTSETLQITEIFHSIQGESTRVGQPCVFVRLTGCPLRCTWCDTDYAFQGGETMSLETILERVQAYGCPLVEVTGGEPLHQPTALVLLKKLCDASFQTMIETSGTFDISAIDSRVSIIMDVKCPGSGMTDRMRWANIEHLSPKDEVKFVLKDQADYEWARDTVTRYRLGDRCTVLFSPVFGSLDLQPLAEWILSDRLPVRFQVQLHKLIWDPETRGV
ncbi:MAG: 7-carboxy-7-deazaguanine synthase QueE [Nitrospirota bacterium]|nr:7-carboxy-7-deazaguanine synthase QueE [Nitrospirota bacterium]MDH5585910.1 7-carboxy-7-deazaguanine synthase QueE [Nitrospirota bacterium]MDH5773979.1 7-carboxy-7-deazaguanine synthase QueE [Nitrospirota bacterium]